MLMITPEPRAHGGLCDPFTAGVTRFGERAREPFEPAGHIARAALRLIESLVIFPLTPTKLGGNTVQPSRAACVLRESHVYDCPPDAAVSVLKGVDGLEPDVGKSGAQDSVQRGTSGAVEPLEKTVHFRAYGDGRRCDVVLAFTADRTAHYFHGSGVASIPANLNGTQPRTAPGKECALPSA